MSLETGTILGVSGHLMSGLWQLNFTNGKFCHIESGFGMRQLVGVLGENFEGQTIHYTTDEFNVLESFSPLNERED